MPISADLIGGACLARYIRLADRISMNDDSFITINAEMSEKTPGGSRTIPGIVTDEDVNFVIPYDDAGRRIMASGTNTHLPVYGRITIEDSALTGTVSFTKRGTAVTGTNGTQFLSQVAVGSLIRFATHAEYVWAEVSTITSDTSLTLRNRYRGATASGSAKRGDWTVSLYIDDPASGETTVSHTGDVDLHVLVSALPLAQASLVDSVLDPRLSFIGTTWNQFVLRETDFTYDAETGLSTSEIPYAPPQNGSLFYGMIVCADGAYDTVRVSNLPSGNAETLREFQTDGTTFRIAGNFQSGGEHALVIRFIV